MTLITENNSAHVNYNGEVMDMYAVKDSNGIKQIFYTQLTSDDIEDMIASPSKEQRLEERLTSDFNCDYNFKKPSKKHIDQYPKTLLNSIKMAEMITPTISVASQTPRSQTPRSQPPRSQTPRSQTRRKQTRRKKIKKKRKRRKTTSISKTKLSQNNTKRIKYTPFSKPRKTKRKYYLTPSSNDKLFDLEKEDDRPSIERTVY